MSINTNDYANQLLAENERLKRERDEAIAAHRKHAASLIADRGLLRERAEAAEAELARRDAAAGDPDFYISQVDIDNLKRANVVEAAISKVIRLDEIPVYTAAPAAVLPPEMFCEKDGEDLLGQAYLAGYNQCRADALALGAQQQRVVELHKRKSTEVISGQRYSYVLLEDLLPELDAAGVKWEVKK